MTESAEVTLIFRNCENGKILLVIKALSHIYNLTIYLLILYICSPLLIDP